MLSEPRGGWGRSLNGLAKLLAKLKALPGKAEITAKLEVDLHVRRCCRLLQPEKLVKLQSEEELAAVKAIATAKVKFPISTALLVTERHFGRKFEAYLQGEAVIPGELFAVMNIWLDVTADFSPVCPKIAEVECSGPKRVRSFERTFL